jgi:hypothetical protein
VGGIEGNLSAQFASTVHVAGCVRLVLVPVESLAQVGILFFSLFSS